MSPEESAARSRSKSPVKDLWPRPVLYGITHRLLFPDLSVEDYLAAVFRTKADVIQWREKDLADQRARTWLESAGGLARLAGKTLLVNTHLEMARELGLDGVHLNSRQRFHAGKERPDLPPEFIVGQSVHSLEEALAAEASGVDYLLLGPLRDPLSKAATGPSLGIDAFTRICGSVHVPVVALGGVTPSDWTEIEGTGAWGMAGISWLADEIRALTH